LDDKGDIYLNYGDDNGDVYLYLVIKMVTFNNGDVLVSVMMLCIIRESLALIGNVLMMWWCVVTWWVGPMHAC